MEDCQDGRNIDGKWTEEEWMQSKDGRTETQETTTCVATSVHVQ